MRRVVGVFIGTSSLVLGFVSPASAFAPTPSTEPTAGGTPTPGTTVCKITDSKVTEASGIVATASGFAVINDSNITQSRERIFMLDSTCKLVSSVGYPTPARDPEDLAVGKDGTLWSADIGDNSALSGGSGQRRTTIALWSLASGGKEPVIHRLAYPDSVARDAEALLISGDGTPVIVTKQPVGEVYVPEGPLESNNTKAVKLKRVGTFTPAKTGTPNPLSFLGEGLVTGGAVSPDGTKAVVRTMSDAYEFDVTSGDVAKAIVSGKYRLTPLPSEPQGEGISFTTDGTSYVTCSDQNGTSAILRYTPASAPLSTKTAGATVASPKAKEKSMLQSLTLQEITYFVAGIGVLGLALVIAGILGIRKSRTKRRSAGASGVYGAAGSTPPPFEDPNRFDPAEDPAAGGNVYGARSPAAAPPRSGSGRAQAAVPPRSGSAPVSGGGGAVYGGGQGGAGRGGAVYGGRGGSDRGGPDPAYGDPGNQGGPGYGGRGGSGRGGYGDDYDQQPRGGGQVYGGPDRGNPQGGGNTYDRDAYQADPYRR